MKIVEETNPAPAIINAIEEFLLTYNAAAVGTYDREVLLLTGRDDKGVLQAGLKGLMGSNWLFIAMLWVAESYRKKGYGSELLRKAEEKAKAQGCIAAFVDTHSFQAPGFYMKHGYTEFGRLDNFPVGHSRIWLSKKL